MIDLLVTSDDTFDLALNPSVLEEFKKKWAWTELFFETPVPLTIGFNKQNRSISKILVFFRDTRPRYIIYGSRNMKSSMSPPIPRPVRTFSGKSNPAF